MVFTTLSEFPSKIIEIFLGSRYREIDRSSLIRDNHTQISNIAGDLSMNMSPWNKDRIIGQKRPLQISHIWGIRIRLELEGITRDLALFNMALDSKLRSGEPQSI